MSSNCVIGNQGSLPWPTLKEDFHFFKNVTKNQKVVMGARTYRSLPRPYLSDRDIYAVSRTGQYYINKYPLVNCNVHHVSFKDPIPQNFPHKDSWLCGGSELYSFFLPICTDLYLTIVLDDYEGDVLMPAFEHLFSQQRLIKEYSNMWIVHYWNRTSLIDESYRDGFDVKLSGQPNHNPYEHDAPASSEIRQKAIDKWNTGYKDSPTLL